MPHSEAQAWWADVQHVRESIERRRADAADSRAPLAAPDERRFTRAAAESLPTMDDLDWSSTLPTRSGRRFDRTTAPHAAGEEAVTSARVDAPHRADHHDAVDDPFDFDTERAALEDARAARDAERKRQTSDPVTATGAAVTALAPPARRTVQITGRTVAAPTLPRLVEVERRRPARRPAERVGPRPDRIALWAVLLGFFLILVAATSSNAATHPSHAASGATVALHAAPR